MRGKLLFPKFLGDSLDRIYTDIDGLTLAKIDEIGIDKLAAAYITRNAAVAVPKPQWDKETPRKDTESRTAFGYEHLPKPPKVQYDRYEVVVPCSGNMSILSTVSGDGKLLPGIASVRDNTIVFTIESPSPYEPAAARAIYDQVKAMTQSFIDALENEFAKFSASIQISIPARLESRKALLEKNRSDLEAFRTKPTV